MPATHKASRTPVTASFITTSKARPVTERTSIIIRLKKHVSPAIILSSGATTFLHYPKLRPYLLLTHGLITHTHPLYSLSLLRMHLLRGALLR